MSGVALYDRIYSAGEETGVTRYQLGRFRDLSDVVSSLDNRVQELEGLVKENRSMLDRRRKEVRKLYSLEATFNAFESEQRRRDRQIADELRSLEQDLRRIAKHVRDDIT